MVVVTQDSPYDLTLAIFNSQCGRHESRSRVADLGWWTYGGRCREADLGWQTEERSQRVDQRMDREWWTYGVCVLCGNGGRVANLGANVGWCIKGGALRWQT